MNHPRAIAGVLFALLTVLLAQVGLKIAQVEIMRSHDMMVEYRKQGHGQEIGKVLYSTATFDREKRDKAVRQIPYGLAEPSEILGLGLAERIDDFSFWNNVAALIAALMVFLAFRVVTKEQLSVETAASFEKALRWTLGNWLVYSIVVTAAGTVYWLGLEDEPLKEIAGTFLCAPQLAAIREVQWIEGLAMMALLLVAPVSLIYAFKLAQYALTALRTRPDPSSLAVGSYVINIGWLPTAVTILGASLVFHILAPIATFADNVIITPPSPHMAMLGGLFAWYSPYLVLSAYFFFSLPSNVNVSFVETIKSLLVIKLAARDSRI